MPSVCCRSYTLRCTGLKWYVVGDGNIGISFPFEACLQQCVESEHVLAMARAR